MSRFIEGITMLSALTLRYLIPGEDNYALTPAKKVALGVADLALCPLESVLSYRVKKDPVDLRAIATIFQKDLSAIVVKDDRIKRPSDLDHKTYASYKARYEDRIVQELVKNDGGQGTFDVVYPEKLGIWDTILNNAYDATWIFMNWEGVQAASQHQEMRYFKLSDYGIPYSYSPVIVGTSSMLKDRGVVMSLFKEATSKGFFEAIQNPEEAAAILKPHLPEADRDMDILACIEASAAALGSQDQWGDNGS